MSTRRNLTPTLDLLKPLVAGLAEPFTLHDVMRVSDLTENTARPCMLRMRDLGWIESGARIQRNGSKLWTRTRTYGATSKSRADQISAGLELLGMCMSGWRLAYPQGACPPDSRRCAAEPAP